MRKLFLATLWMVLLSTTQHVYALGVGDIEVYSALNQPLDAEITLTSVRPGETDGMIVKLASEIAFQHAGVPRPFYLTKLKFELLGKPDGTRYIKVTTHKPVKEPFLSFLVDIEWHRGRLVREYTVLLDPPIFASHPQKSVVTEAPQTSITATVEESSKTADLPDIVVSTASEPALIERSTEAEDSFLSDDDGQESESVDFATDTDTEQQPFLLDTESEEPLLEETASSSETLSDIDSEELQSEINEVDSQGTQDEEALISEDFEQQLESEAETLAKAETESTQEITDDYAAEDFSESPLAEDTADESFFEEEIDTDSDESLILTESEISDEAEEASSDFISDDTAEDNWPVDEESSVLEDQESLLVEEEQVSKIAEAYPDIAVSLDSNIPYDVEATERLLAEFDDEDKAKSRFDFAAEEYEVKQGDTLMEIASGIRPAEVDINQAMLAILRHNPDAFLRDNINNVKKGVVLRIPNQQEMLDVNGSDAMLEVQRQNALWREYKSQLTGTSASDYDDQSYEDSYLSDTGSSQDDSARLSIVAPDQDSEISEQTLSEQSGNETGTVSSNELLLAQESLEAIKLEKAELQDRLNDLENQVSMMDRLIKLKDQKLAKLQAQLSQADSSVLETSQTDSEIDSELESLQQTVSASQNDTSSIDIDSSVADLDNTELTTDAGESELQETTVEDEQVTDNGLIDEEIQAAEDITVDDALAETSIDDSAITEETDPLLTAELQEDSLSVDPLDLDIASDESEPTDETISSDDTSSEELIATANEEEVVLDPEQEAVAPEKPVNSLSFLYEFLPGPYDDMVKDLIDQPYGLPALIAVPLVLFLLVLLLIRNRKKVHAEFEPLEAFEERHEEASIDISPDEVYAEAEEEEVVDLAEPEPSFESERTQMINKVVESAAEESAQVEQTVTATEDEEAMDDTTAEADVYLAYGLFDQAEDLLKQALSSEPNKKEYTSKLLETYYAAGKKEQFESLAQEFRTSLGSQPGRFWDKAVAMGKEIAPNNNLFSGEADSGLKASDFAPAKPATADIDLGGETSTTPDVDLGAVDDMKMDFDLGDDATVTSTAQDTIISPTEDSTNAAQATAESNELEFDLSDSSAFEEQAEELGADLDLDFNADDLGLSEEDEENIASAQDVDIEIGAEDAHAQRASEETVALDMDMQLDDLDLGEITHTGDADFDLDDLDDLGDMDESEMAAMSPAGEALIAEMDDAGDLTVPGDDDITEAGEETYIDDDDDNDETIIDSSFDETFSGGEISSMDEVNTKLDLAKAYIDMGDNDGASSTLSEVIAEGSEPQRKEAEDLLRQLSQ